MSGSPAVSSVEEVNSTHSFPSALKFILARKEPPGSERLLNGIHAKLVPVFRSNSHSCAESREGRSRAISDHLLQRSLNGSRLIQCAFGLTLMCPRLYSARSWVNTRMPDCRNTSRATR